MDTETRYDQQKKAQTRNDRNALITGLAGLVIVFFGFYVIGTSTEAAGGWVIVIAGAIAFAVGMYYRGRPVR